MLATPLLVGLLTGCVPELAAGEWGTFRYFGELEGEPPNMTLLPPLSDRDGNVYVLWGDRENSDNDVFVGSALGGWSGGCSAHRGSFGLHGFVGRSDSQAWYWAGDALVQVDGETGACAELLTTDPVTGTELAFLGVIPLVDETPSHRLLPAMVQGSADTWPYLVVVDLDQGLYFEAREFEADDLVVVGTGANPATREGVYLVSYGGQTQLIRYDARTGVTGTTQVLSEELDEYALLGFLQFNDAGIGAGLLADGRVLVIGGNGGQIIAVGGMEPAGLIRFDGELWLTGIAGGQQAVAAVTNNGVGTVQAWSAAQRAQAQIGSGVRVLDERSDPSRTDNWGSADSAIGSQVLLSPWPLDTYTVNSTGWLIAGPGYSTASFDRTAVAFAPVGISVP